MGLFSWLSGEGKRGRSKANAKREMFQETTLDMQPEQPKRKKSLTEQIELCFYLNAKCLGTALVVRAREGESEKLSETCSMMGEFTETLVPILPRLMRLESARDATWLVPDSFKRRCKHQASREYDQYLLDMGELALAEEAEKRDRDTTETTIIALRNTTLFAIARCISLLETAHEEGAEDVLSFMREDPDYLVKLIRYFLNLDVSLMHVTAPQSVVFIPDSGLEPGSPYNVTRLYDQRFDVDETSPGIPTPDQLCLLWGSNENGDSTAGRGQIERWPGIYCCGTYCWTNGDEQLPGYLDRLAENIAAGIQYV